MVIDTQSRGGVPLRVKVDHQNTCAVKRERGGKIDRRGRLAHPTLLVGHHHDARPVRTGQALTGAAKGLDRQLGRATDGCVIHRRRCFT